MATVKSVASAGTSVLEVDSVRFAYPCGTEVLRGATLRAVAGSCQGLAGPNGAGKSTLLRVAAGLLRPTEGEVRLFGRPMTAIPRLEAARMIAWVPQETETAFAFTAREVALMGRYPHLGPLGFESERDRAIASACLDEVGAGHLADRPIAELSGGEKRRVAIASALAQEPGVLLLDEPTAGLDLAAQVTLANIITRLAAKGLAIVVVTHDLNVAARFCDRLSLMQNGAVAFEGTPSEALTGDRLSSLYGTTVRVWRGEDDDLPIAMPEFGALKGASR